MRDDASSSPPRRYFLRQVVRAAGSAPLVPQLGAAAAAAALAGNAAAADAPAALPVAPAANPVPVPLPAGYQSLSADEAAFTEAMLNIMCPADQFTPNGVDCGLAMFFDRQLSGAFGQGAGRYLQGPWAEGKPQLGVQLPLTPEQFFKAGVAAANRQSLSKYGKRLEQLPASTGDAFLNDIGNGKINDAEVPLALWFNELVYPLFTQACFADPLYGGNRDKVFWKMVGYPGLPATHTLDMVNFRGKPYPGAATPKSILDFS